MTYLLYRRYANRSFLLFNDVTFSDKRNVVRRKDNFPIAFEAVKQLIDGFAEIIA